MCRHFLQRSRFPFLAKTGVGEGKDKSHTLDPKGLVDFFLKKFFFMFEKLCEVSNIGIRGVITGTAIYEGTLDFKKAQELAEHLTG